MKSSSVRTCPRVRKVGWKRFQPSCMNEISCQHVVSSDIIQYLFFFSEKRSICWLWVVEQKLWKCCYPRHKLFLGHKTKTDGIFRYKSKSDICGPVYTIQTNFHNILLRKRRTRSAYKFLVDRWVFSIYKMLPRWEGSKFSSVQFYFTETLINWLLSLLLRMEKKPEILVRQ